MDGQIEGRDRALAVSDRWITVHQMAARGFRNDTRIRGDGGSGGNIPACVKSQRYLLAARWVVHTSHDGRY